MTMEDVPDEILESLKERVVEDVKRASDLHDKWCKELEALKNNTVALMTVAMIDNTAATISPQYYRRVKLTVENLLALEEKLQKAEATEQ